MDSSASKNFELTAAVLHIIAMTLMLMDHLWATLLPAREWLACAGRVAFPIFAFMAVEGYFHTRSFKKYILRMLLFAVLSEIPFDLMYGGTWFYPVHQNVLWTFLLSLLGVWLMEQVRKKGKTWMYLLVCVLVVLAGLVLGTLCMVDYYGVGVLTVFVFYFLHGRKWWCFLGQLAALYWLNVELLGGLMYPVQLFGMEFELCQQGLALLALIPIWLYRGRQGYHSKPFQYLCYAFYPVHMLLLVVVLLQYSTSFFRVLAKLWTLHWKEEMRFVRLTVLQSTTLTTSVLATLPLLKCWLPWMNALREA